MPYSPPPPSVAPPPCGPGPVVLPCALSVIPCLFCPRPICPPPSVLPAPSVLHCPVCFPICSPVCLPSPVCPPPHAPSVSPHPVCPHHPICLCPPSASAPSVPTASCSASPSEPPHHLSTSARVPGHGGHAQHSARLGERPTQVRARSWRQPPAQRLGHSHSPPGRLPTVQLQVSLVPPRQPQRTFEGPGPQAEPPCCVTLGPEHLSVSLDRGSRAGLNAGRHAGCCRDVS